MRLGVDRLDFAKQVALAGGVRELIKPPPVRSEEEQVHEASRVREEKERMKVAHPLLANL